MTPHSSPFVLLSKVICSLSHIPLHVIQSVCIPCSYLVPTSHFVQVIRNASLLPVKHVQQAAVMIARCHARTHALAFESIVFDPTINASAASSQFSYLDALPTILSDREWVCATLMCACKASRKGCHPSPLGLCLLLRHYSGQAMICEECWSSTPLHLFLHFFIHLHAQANLPTDPR